MISKKYAMRHSSGAAWTFIPAPDQNVDRSPVRVGGSHVSLGGQTTNDTINSFRTFVLNFTLLSPAEFAVLDQFRTIKGPHFYTDDAGATSFNVLVMSLPQAWVVNGYSNCTLTLQEAF
jgi:hypothetical protein